MQKSCVDIDRFSNFGGNILKKDAPKPVLLLQN